MKYFCKFLLLWLFLPWAALAVSPSLALPDIDGRYRPVSEFIGRGQWTVVVLWSIDCPICQQELPSLEFLYDERQKNNTVVLGLSVDGLANRARVKQFLDQYTLNFPQLLGEPADAVRLGAKAMRGTPTYLFFSPKGELLSQRIGATTLEEIERTITKLGGPGPISSSGP